MKIWSAFLVMIIYSLACSSSASLHTDRLIPSPPNSSPSSRKAMAELKVAPKSSSSSTLVTVSQATETQEKDIFAQPSSVPTTPTRPLVVQKLNNFVPQAPSPSASTTSAQRLVADRDAELERIIPLISLFRGDVIALTMAAVNPHPESIKLIEERILNNVKRIHKERHGAELEGAELEGA
ncbi:MAG: hypothetical protein K6C34_02550, partial [Alphaproteobacteria bacterium]|nr:hypothetical protein [Alphaproteobacteria bacterium]